jgi:regulator of CtrA degradation
LRISATAALWHQRAMLARRLIDGLYMETMVLADEARSYFDEMGRVARDSLTPLDRVVFSCESLKVTTRLMHVIAWLLTQKAIEAGEMPADAARAPSRRLGAAVISEDASLAKIPDDARSLVAASIDLYRRVERLDHGLESTSPAPSPARSLLNKLERAF